jgi:hypothetical protein
MDVLLHAPAVSLHTAIHPQDTGVHLPGYFRRVCHVLRFTFVIDVRDHLLAGDTAQRSAAALEFLFGL